MDNHHRSVVKTIEITGSSDQSFSDAVRNAVRVASGSLRNIVRVDVVSSSAEVGQGGQLIIYNVSCRLAFRVDGRRIDVGDEEDDTPTGADLTLGGGLPHSAH